MRQWAKNHPWPFGLCVALGFCLLANALLWSRLRAAQEFADRHRTTAAEMRQIVQEYLAVKERAELQEAPLLMAGAEGLSPAAIEKIAREKGVADSISSTSENTLRPDERLREHVVVLSLDAVRREDLARFLFAVEDLDRAIRTKALRLSVSRTASTLIDATVTFSAYEATTTVSE